MYLVFLKHSIFKWRVLVCSFFFKEVLSQAVERDAFLRCGPLWAVGGWANRESDGQWDYCCPRTDGGSSAAPAEISTPGHTREDDSCAPSSHFCSAASMPWASRGFQQSKFEIREHLITILTRHHRLVWRPCLQAVCKMLLGAASSVACASFSHVPSREAELSPGREGAPRPARLGVRLPLPGRHTNLGKMKATGPVWSLCSGNHH